MSYALPQRTVSNSAWQYTFTLVHFGLLTVPFVAAMVVGVGFDALGGSFYGRNEREVLGGLLAAWVLASVIVHTGSLLVRRWTNIEASADGEGVLFGGTSLRSFLASVITSSVVVLALAAPLLAGGPTRQLTTTAVAGSTVAVVTQLSTLPQIEFDGSADTPAPAATVGSGARLMVDASLVEVDDGS